MGLEDIIQGLGRTTVNSFVKSTLCVATVLSSFGCGQGGSQQSDKNEAQQTSAPQQTIEHSSLPRNIQDLALEGIGFNDPVYCKIFVLNNSFETKLVDEEGSAIPIKKSKKITWNNDLVIEDPRDVPMFGYYWGPFLSCLGYFDKSNKSRILEDYTFGKRTDELLEKGLISASRDSYFGRGVIRISLAKRTLDSITKVEHFDGKRFQKEGLGELREMYSFVFKYRLETLLPELPEIDQKFPGRATITKDITTEEWEVVKPKIMSLDPKDWAFGDYQSQLNDKGAQIFEDFAKAREEIMNLKAEELRRQEIKDKQENMTAKLAGYKTGDNWIAVEFGIDGGKPPFSYRVSFNDRPLEEIIRSHISVQIVPRGFLVGWSGKDIVWDPNRQPVYWIEESRPPSDEIEYGLGKTRKITIGANHGFRFAFPQDATFPITVKINASDSSSPPHQATIEKIIEEGEHKFISPIPKDAGDGYAWLEINGKPQVTYDIAGKWDFNDPYIDDRDLKSKIRKANIQIQQNGTSLSGTFTEKTSLEPQQALKGNIEGTIRSGYVEFVINYENVKKDPVKYQGFVTSEGTIESWFNWKKRQEKNKLYSWGEEWCMDRISKDITPNEKDKPPAAEEKIPEKEKDLPIDTDKPAPEKETEKPTPNLESKMQYAVPNGRLGEFRHGTLVTKVRGELIASASEDEATHTHPGIDMAAPEGTGIYALADGTVTDLINAQKDPNWDSLGYMVTVRHNKQLGRRDTYSLYLHMKEQPGVGLNDEVKEGRTLLGKVGATGSATGPHTHIEVRYFPSRFLEDKDWNYPLNIYGKGNQTRTKRFYDSWEDPARVFSGQLGLPEIGWNEEIRTVHKKATDLILNKRFKEGTDIYLPMLKKIDSMAANAPLSEEERRNIWMVAAYNIASYWVAAEGNVREALPWFEESFKNGFFRKLGMKTIRSDEDLAGIRENPEFVQLVNKYSR